MPSLCFFVSFVFLLAYATALICNQGVGGLSAPLVNVTCKNATECYRLDLDFANGTLRTSTYDCDENNSTCAKYAVNSNNSIANGTNGGGYLYCCNSNNCNYRRSATRFSIFSVLSAIFLTNII